jgi:hypothetical protein
MAGVTCECEPPDSGREIRIRGCVPWQVGGALVDERLNWQWGGIRQEMGGGGG